MTAYLKAYIKQKVRIPGHLFTQALGCKTAPKLAYFILEITLVKQNPGYYFAKACRG